MNAKITLVELAELMAKATSTSKRMCELFLRELFATISQALIEGESVKIKGVGTFKVTQVKSRKSVSVTTGDAVEISSYKKLSFTPDKSLAEAVNQPFAHFETVVLADETTDEKLADIDKQYPSLFLDEEDVPEPPEDLPVPPVPGIEDIAEIAAQPVGGNQASSVASSGNSMPQDEEPVEKRVAVAPAKAVPIEKNDTAPVKVAPLMGIPIDGPSAKPQAEKEPEPAPTAAAEPKPQPKPKPVEEEEEDNFYRPAPRNAYTPTREQIEKQQKKPNYKRWIYIALGVLAAGLLLWLLLKPSGKTEAQENEPGIVMADTVAAADTIVTESTSEPKPETKPETKSESKPKAEPKVVTDIVTSQIVLSTLAEKYYGSAWFWVYIYEENKAIISDPNNIRPGTKVVIPPVEKYGIDAKNPASLKKAQRRSWEILKGK